MSNRAVRYYRPMLNERRAFLLLKAAQKRGRDYRSLAKSKKTPGAVAYNNNLAREYEEIAAMFTDRASGNPHWEKQR